MRRVAWCRARCGRITQNNAVVRQRSSPSVGDSFLLGRATCARGFFLDLQAVAWLGDVTPDRGMRHCR